MSKEFYFKLDDKEDDRLKMSSVFLFDEHAIREIFPKEIAALLEFRDHIIMMSDDSLEMSFGNLKRQAEELDGTFKNLMKILKLENKNERKKSTRPDPLPVSSKGG